MLFFEEVDIAVNLAIKNQNPRQRTFGTPVYLGPSCGGLEFIKEVLRWI